MKRFVDLRGQDLNWRFAWYDTVRDEFESFNGEQVFDTWDEFAEVCSSNEIEQYRRLCPQWVFEKGRCIYGDKRS